MTRFSGTSVEKEGGWGRRAGFPLEHRWYFTSQSETGSMVHLTGPPDKFLPLLPNQKPPHTSGLWGAGPYHSQLLPMSQLLEFGWIFPHKCIA